MRMRAILCAMIGLGLASNLRAEGLTIGDPAPEIKVAKFVKGEPVEKLEAGKVYVVEFWATWCGPCIATIPHLTELQKKHKDVTFIGVSVFESDQKEVVPFVAKMGDKMDYRVAMDEVAKGAEPIDGKMATAWMNAAEEGGIPTAFIVNKDRKVAWIGHPAEMDEPLAEIVAGKYDIKQAAKKRDEAKIRGLEMQELFGKLQPLLENPAKNSKEIVALVDKAIARDPELEISLAGLKLNALMRDKDDDAFVAFANRLIDDKVADNADMLNNVAWTIVDPDDDYEATKAELKVALKAAEKANNVSKGESAAILDTYALALFENRDVLKAVEMQEKAVKLDVEENEGMIARLKKYKAAVEK